MPLGNSSGPHKATIIAGQPAEFYGTTPDLLAEDVNQLTAEETSVVEPVDIDQEGRIYITALAAGGKMQHLYIPFDHFVGNIEAIFDGEVVPREVEVTRIEHEARAAQLAP